MTVAQEIMDTFDVEKDKERAVCEMADWLIEEGVDAVEAYEKAVDAYEMLPLRLRSFEVYLKEKGYSDEQIQYLKKCCEEDATVVDEVHCDTLETVEDQPWT